MAVYICAVCDTPYDEEKERVPWEDLPSDWVCPVCDSPKSMFSRAEGAAPRVSPEATTESGGDSHIGPAAPISTEIPTVSDLMVDTMIKWGIQYVFGMVGHSNLGLADAIRRRCALGDLNFIGIRHEGAASFAASAYAKLRGKPAACLSIAGPGATNLLTGLWDAKLDRVPVLALTGQVDIQFLGPGAFQEVNLAAAFQSVACWSQTVLESSNHVELMNLALKNAVLRRDVAHLIFPNKVQEMPVSWESVTSGPAGRLTPLSISPPAESLEAAASLFRRSERPVVIVGHGARFCMSEIIRFADHFHLPVITTFKGKGLIPDDHPLACGVLGLSGTPVSSWFMKESDLLIVFGASFAKHTGITQDTPTIQVDYDPLTLGKFHPVTVPIWGEIGRTVELLENELIHAKPKSDRIEEIASQWTHWRAQKNERELEDQGKGMNSAAVFSVLTREVPENAVIAVDVGNNTYSFGRYFECRSQSVLMSGYLGSIGYGYPAAIGAWAAAPERPIVAITGDGGFGQYMAEVTTAVKYGIPIKHILLNNMQLGKIRKEQITEKKMVWSTSLHNPNFAQYAENCGALGIRVTKKDALQSALKKVIDHEGPAMLEIMTDGALT
jgi:thiamine pyrophosphate-dependent acetolactate synthase large subunit-like protein/rubredoxin